MSRYGMFLVESIVALAILALVVHSLIQGVTNGIQVAQLSKQQSQAAIIAESIAEEIRLASASGTWGVDVWAPGADLQADGNWHNLTSSTIPPARDNAFVVSYRAFSLSAANLQPRHEIQFPPIQSPPAPLASQTATGIIASAAGPGITFCNLVDNNTSTFWRFSGAIPPGGVLIDFIASYPFIASEFRIYCKSNNTPRNWSLSGLTPSGTWQNLNTWVNETWPSEGWRTFSFPEPTPPASYSIYRMAITARNGSRVDIYEVDFPHKYVSSQEQSIFQPGSVIQVELRVTTQGSTDPSDGAKLTFLVARRGAN